jgi:YggT family protein
LISVGYFGGVGMIVVQAVFGLLLFVAVLRVLLPLAGARFRNPICQLIYRVTNPVLVPLTRAVPNVRGVSVAGILLAWFVALLYVGLVLLLANRGAGAGIVALLSIGVLVHFVLSLYFWTIIIRALMSFFSPDMGNPAVEVLHDLTDPVLKPFQKLPPRNMGIDLSPLYACVAIRIAQYTLSHLGLPAFPLL